MFKAINYIALFVFVTTAFKAVAQDNPSLPYHDPYRPQVHFSPKYHWMNDPNGMVYFNHTYHLFFQYYPGDIVWGPMHWGHATSTDMMHWTEQPIALYPDSLGYIFSGSAVVDVNNTSGFGKHGKTPLVAIFTHHNPKGEKSGTNNFQNQSLAYSLDNGATWTKYAGNPVLKNPGITDFRDPKVMWYAPQKKWVMTLATKDRITFYSSPNLKSWKRESEFGSDVGAHGGVWECPDLFTLQLNGKTYWVLIVNINPGGPNGGSATQYFIGQFNGNKFTPVNTSTRWLDYGPDEYAGVTWGNTGARKIFLGWMSNWLYANQVPTRNWRSAMTVPRELRLIEYKKSILIASSPVTEMDNLKAKTVNAAEVKVGSNFDLTTKTGQLANQYVLKLNLKTSDNYSIEFSNSQNEKLVIGFDKVANQYYIDRSQSGNVGFNKDFGRRHTTPRLSGAQANHLTLIIDASSIELFADDGATVMTSIFFATKPYSKATLQSGRGTVITNLTYSVLKPGWKM